MGFTGSTLSDGKTSQRRNPDRGDGFRGLSERRITHTIGNNDHVKVLPFLTDLRRLLQELSSQRDDICSQCISGQDAGRVPSGLK
jgi:hypothetical protein